VRFPKAYADTVAKLRVPGGFILLAAFLVLALPTARSLAVGFPVSILGLALRAWAAGHLEKNTTLTESGPYAWVRNPLYLGTLLATLGLVLASRRWELAGLSSLVFFLIYLPVVELEEQHLNQLFPEFSSYARRVPKLVPRRPSKQTAKTFRWSVYRRNEEYQASLGFLVGAGVLVWKAIS